MRDQEYDRFGPWVIEISDEDPPPPLFVPHLTREEPPLLSVKVPRHIERRRAHPGMDLYDYVVSLYQDDLVILERAGHEVRSAQFHYRDIQCLMYSVELLDGNLHLAMPGTEYTLPFNTVSSDIMERVVDLIRERYLDETSDGEAVSNPAASRTGQSFLFERLVPQHELDYPGFRIQAVQADTPVGTRGLSRLHRLFFGAIGKKLLESIHFFDGRELKIINRGRTYRYRGQPIYGTSVYYFPTTRISGIDWESDERLPSIVSLVATTSGGRFSFSFSKDNPSLPFYADSLSKLTETANRLVV